MPEGVEGQRTVARPTSASLVDGFRIAPAFGGHGARVARACPVERSLTRVLFDAPTSDAFVTMWLPRAEPFRLEALAAVALRSLRFQNARSPRGGRLGRHLIVERLGRRTPLR